MENNVHLEAFAANYEVTYQLRTIDPEQIYRISHDREGKSHLAVDTLQITPHGGKRWEGEFFQGSGISGAYSTPNPDVLCVVSAGEGYLVDPLRPLEFRVLTIAVQDVFQFESTPAIVFVSFTAIAIYNGLGDIWVSERISWDGIRGIKIQADKILGQAWLAPSNEWYDFSIDLATRTVHGNRFEI